MLRPLLRVLKYAAVLGACYFIIVFCYDVSHSLIQSYLSHQGIDEFDKQLEQVLERVERAAESSDKLKFELGDLNRELGGTSRKTEELKKRVNEQAGAERRNPKIDAVRRVQPTENLVESKSVVPEATISSDVRKRLASSIVPVLVIACDRATVSQALDKLIASRKSALNAVARIPIVISQDNCQGVGATATTKVIEQYVAGQTDVHFIRHKNESDPAPTLDKRSRKWALGYYKLSRHYRWALDQIFYSVFKNENDPIDAVTIVEDDLEVSPDFFGYILAGYEYLLQEEVHGHGDEFMCVSAWNDNGKDANIDIGEAGMMKAHLTDFFPGLGWLLRRNIWSEFRTKWPAAYWDDWVRLPEQRKNRACIRPEISRSHTFGKKGVSNGQFYDKHLKFIRLADKAASIDDWRQSLLPLAEKPKYNERLAKLVESAKLTNAAGLRTECSGSSSKETILKRIEYNNEGGFKAAAKALGLMTDSKSGVPRTGYIGIVESQYHNCRVFISPPVADLRRKYFQGNGYDVKWTGKP